MQRLVMAAAIAAVLVLSSSCASAPPPDPRHPMRACAVSCPDGRILFESQHLCDHGRRWFRDIWIVGEMPNAVASWIGCDAPPGVDGKCEEVVYRKIDVAVGTCSELTNRLDSERDPSKRGRHPGEDVQGNPRNP